MDRLWIWILVTIVALILGAVIGYYIKNLLVQQKLEREKAAADHLITEANERAMEIELEAKNKTLELRQNAEADVRRKRVDLQREEDRLAKRREEMDLRTDRLEKREQMINKRQSALDKRANDLDKLHEQEMEELQRISKMTTDDARAMCCWQR